MNVDKLIERTKAEFVTNQAIARIDDEPVIIAQVVGDKMVFTDEGEKLAEAFESASKSKKDAKKKDAAGDSTTEDGTSEDGTSEDGTSEDGTSEDGTTEQ